jgi:hypothetical protein
MEAEKERERAYKSVKERGVLSWGQRGRASATDDGDDAAAYAVGSVCLLAAASETVSASM